MADPLIYVKQQAPTWLKGEVDLLMRNRIELLLMQSKGKMQMNTKMTSLNWNVRYRRPPTQQMGDATELVYSRQDIWKQAALPGYGGYYASDAMTEKEKTVLGGPSQILDRATTILPGLTSAVKESLSADIYYDNSAANETRLYGLESMLADDGATATGDIVANPSDTYCGLSTALGNVGGSWSSGLGSGSFPNATAATDWPDGQGSYEYDYFSPLLLNTTSSNWGTGGSTWTDNCFELLRYALMMQMHRGGPELQPEIFITSTSLFRQFKTAASNLFRIDLPWQPGQDLGFSGAQILNFEGTGIQASYTIPAGTGYGWNSNMAEMLVAHSQLIEMQEPFDDRPTGRTLFRVFSYPQLRFFPKGFVKFKAYA